MCTYIYIFIRIIIIIIIITSSSDPHHDIISFIYSDIFSDILSGMYILTFFLAFYQAFYLIYLFSHSICIVCDILHSQLRSRSAHWDLALAVEVRQCPLSSGTRGWGGAAPTDIWHSLLGSGSAHWDLELAVDAEGGRGSRRRQAEAGGGGQHFWKNLGTWQVGNYWWFIPSNQD